MKQYLLNEDSEPRYTYCYGFDVKVYDRSELIKLFTKSGWSRQTRSKSYDSSFKDEVDEFIKDAIVKILLDIKASHSDFVRSVQFADLDDWADYLIAQCSLFVTKTLTEQEIKDMFNESFTKIGNPELMEVKKDEVDLYDDQISSVSYFDIEIDKNITNIEKVEEYPPEKDFPELDKDEI